MPSPTPNRRDRLAVGVVCALALFASSCASQAPRGEVEGTVTLDGQPLEGIAVTFLPEPGQSTGGASASGVTDERGRYKLLTDDNRPGVVTGHHRVTLRDLKNNQGGRFLASRGRSDDAQPKKAPAGAAVRHIPKDYEDASATPLRRDVHAGPQTLDFELTKEPARRK